METIGDFSVSSAPDSFNEIYDIIDEIVIKTGLAGREKYRFTLCITEAFTNACIHGNDRNPRKRVNLIFQRQGDRLIVTIEDEGSGRVADIPQAFELKRIKSENFSGRGVAIMQEFADNFSVVEKSDSGLRVYLEWNLAGKPAATRPEIDKS